MADIPLLTKQLKDLGYGTHLIGKWGIDDGGRLYNAKFHKWVPNVHFNRRKNKGLGPNGRYFDTFYGFYNHYHDHYDKVAGGIPDWHHYDITKKNMF